MSERDLNITFASSPHPDSTLTNWTKALVNILPRVTPHVRSKEFLQRYLDIYGVDLSGVPITDFSLPNPKMSDPASVEGLACEIDFPKQVEDFKKELGIEGAFPYQI